MSETDHVVVLEGSDGEVFAIPTDVLRSFRLPDAKAEEIRERCAQDVQGFDAGQLTSQDGLGDIQVLSIASPLSWFTEPSSTYSTPSVGSGEFWSR